MSRLKFDSLKEPGQGTFSECSDKVLSVKNNLCSSKINGLAQVPSYHKLPCA